MWELYYHMRRYLTWSAFGIAVFLMPMLPWIRPRERLGLLLIVTGFGGSIFVLVRAVVGAVTRWSAGRADCATAKGIGIFFIGCLVALFVATSVFIDAKANQLIQPWVPRLAKYPLLVALLIVLIVSVLIGWLTHGKRAWLFLPIAWLATPSQS